MAEWTQTIEVNKPSSAATAIETKHLLRFGILLAVLMVLVILAYSPVVGGPFLFDDYRNLNPLGEEGGVSDWSTFRKFVFGNSSGPSVRPVAMLSFLIDAQNWPANAVSFKCTNIMIHVLSDLMLCWLASELFQSLGIAAQRSAMLGLLGTALWMLHPFSGSTTLYVVQRMAQLMTFFGLSSLLCYLKGRRLVLSNPKQGLFLLCLSLFPFALLSVLSKENGVLLLMLTVIFEFIIFRFEPRNSALIAWFRAGVLAPLAVFGIYLVFTFTDSVAAYEFRHFSLLERLLSESRILAIYLAKIFLPIDAGVNLFHDDFQISKSLLSPLSTLFSILFLLGLAGVAWFWRKSQAVLSLGIA